MILVTPERALSLRDLLDNAVSRLGIKQLAGDMGLYKPLSRFCVTGFDNLADLPFFLRLETICIVPLRHLPSSEGAQTFPLLQSTFSVRVNTSTAACVVLAGADQIPEFLIHHLGNSEMILFSSVYDEYLLESRLIGLIREKTERRTTISGGLVNLDGMGIMITGESGLGKTSCALELVKRGHRWVADDVVMIEKKSNELLYGRSYDFEFPLLEIKGWGIVRAEEVMPSSSIMRETRIDCLIELVDKEEMENREEQGDPLRIMNIIGTNLLCIPLAVSGDASHMAAEVESCIRTLRQLRRLR